MELVYNILVFSFCVSKYFTFDNNVRIIILLLTYPLLALNCYNISLAIHKREIGKVRVEIFQVILFSLVINYFQTNEILFDIDDYRRYLIIISSLLLFFFRFFKYYNK